jgi:hypothetical protein
MMNDVVSVAFLLLILAVVIGIFIRICLRVRGGGGSQIGRAHV